MSPRAAQVAEPEVAITLPPSLARQFRRLADRTQVQLSRDASITYTRYVAFEQGRLALDPAEIRSLLSALLPQALAKLPRVEKVEREDEHVGADDVA